MSFNIHPSAIQNFNKKAQELISLIKEFIENSTKKNSFPTDLYISANLTKDDIIGEVVESTINNNGETIEKFFRIKNKIYGLREEDYKELKKVSERIQLLPAFTKSISLSYIEEKLFEWVKSAFLSKDSNILFMEYFQNEAKVIIQSFSLWIPIANLGVENPFSIGKSEIIPLSKAKLDDWEATYLANLNPDSLADLDVKYLENLNFEQIKKNLADTFHSIRKDYQGLACVVTTIEAEQKYAHDYALEQAQKITSILSILSGAVSVPNDKSFSQIKGSENISQAALFFEINNKITNISQGIIEKNSPRTFMINGEILQEMNTMGLGKISYLLALEPEELRPFEKQVLTFLLLYSKASFTDEPIEKLVYILSALESILLRPDNEPIQQNLGERLAFFISDKLDERKAIVKNLRSVYGFRSKYIHHGSSSSELETIQEFLFFVFRFFIMLINNFHVFSQKEDFLNYIDDKKLS
jgi:hypothetical protein